MHNNLGADQSTCSAVFDPSALKQAIRSPSCDLKANPGKKALG
jgi:hypothetical protein